MKCPKCGYISFDFNQTCPKCNKDISAEQQKLNIPSFKPTPHFLLGALLGETGEPGADLKIDLAPGARPAESPPDVVSLEDLEKLHPDDSEQQLREEAPTEFAGPEELISIEDLSMPEAVTAEEPAQEQMPEEISFEEFDSFPASPPPVETVKKTQDDELLSIDLDDIDLDDTKDIKDMIPEESKERSDQEDILEIDLDALSLETDIQEKGDQKTETEDEQLPEELSMDDLFDALENPKETGEKTAEILPDLNAIVLDEEEPKPAEAETEQGGIEIEGLELDLDLEKPDEKSS